MDELKDFIKNYRVNILCVTQNELANIAGVSIRTVQNWEAGVKIPSKNNLGYLFGNDASLLQKALYIRKRQLNTNKDKIEDIDDRTEINYLNDEYLSKKIKKQSDSPIPKKYFGKNITVDYQDNNLNTLVLGCGGAGKNYHYIEPNLIYDNTGSNFILSTAFLNTSVLESLKEKGYKIISNYKEYTNYNNDIQDKTIISYNPFLYFEDENCIIQFVKTLIKNRYNEYFFENGIRQLLCNTFIYVWKTYQNPLGTNYPNKDYNLHKVFDILSTTTTKNLPEYLLVGINVSKRTLENIHISAAALIDSLFHMELNISNENDTMYLYDFFDHDKIALLYNLNATTKNTLFGLVLTQFCLISKTRVAAMHCKIILDEYVNCAVNIINFNQALSKIFTQSKNISVDIIFQNISQIECLNNVKLAYLISKCDSILLMDTCDILTAEYLSSISGFKSIGFIKKKIVPYINIYDIKSLPANKCIVFIKGKLPVVTEKLNS